MTQFIIVVIVSFFSFAKCCVKTCARYKELKLLKDSGAKHVVISKTTSNSNSKPIMERK